MSKQHYRGIFPWFTVIEGMAGFFMQCWLFSSVDDSGLLPPYHIAGILSFVLLALTLVICWFGSKGEKDLCPDRLFFSSVPAAIGIGLSAVGVAFSAFTASGTGILQILTFGTGILAAAALGYIAVCRAKKFHADAMLHCIVTVYLILRTMTNCSGWSAEPQFQLYFFPLLACVFLMITGFLGKIPKGFLTVGTAILSGFLISIRLPRLKKALRRRLPEKVQTNVLPALKRTKSALFAWLKAQAKLMAITFCILLVGFLLLRIPYGILWAAVVAVVDAVPVLGTGTILLPWAVVSLLQGKQLLAIGLLVIYGITFVTRTALEPRIIGRSLNLDPLLTLIFLYIGFHFWGFLGLVFTPILASGVISALKGIDNGQSEMQNAK